MPYKDKEKQKESQRTWVRQRRKKKSPVEPRNVEPVLLSRPNGADYDPDELLPDGRKRYLGPFSDSQVLDRTTVPKVVLPAQYQQMPSVVFTPNCKRKAEALHRVGKVLDREVTGLAGRRESMLDMVRYGIEGPTIREIMEGTNG